MLTTNFGSLCPDVPNFCSQNFSYEIWFCTRLIKKDLKNPAKPAQVPSSCGKVEENSTIYHVYRWVSHGSVQGRRNSSALAMEFCLSCTDPSLSVFPQNNPAHEGFIMNAYNIFSVLAASSIANIVKSSLGPVGLDKMLVDDVGVSPYFSNSCYGLNSWSLLMHIWNCSQMHASEPYWLELNIGSGNGLVLSCNKPSSEPMLGQIYFDKLNLHQVLAVDK